MDTVPSKSRLLIIDGDPKSLRVLDVSLKKAGFEVTTASSRRDAFALLESSAPDLIISDTDLDGTDGFDLCRQIKARPEWNKIPFLFVSSRKSIEDKIRGLELGVEDYLSKPIYIKEIGIRVRTALQRAVRERMESRRDGRTRFAGDLSDVGVVDLVQTIEINRKSGIIHIVNRDNRRGSIFFRDGKVVDAEVGRLSGANALYRLFSWSDGEFAVEFKQIRRHDVIDTSTAQLLMEGMRRLDEATRLLEKLPSTRAVLEVDCRVLADELAELPDEVNSVLRLCDGTRTLQEVIEDSDHSDFEALGILSRLFANQVIFAREPADRGGESQPGERLSHWLSEGVPEDGAAAEEPTSSSDPATADLELGESLDAKPPRRGMGSTLKLPAVSSLDHSFHGAAVVEASPEGAGEPRLPRGADTLKGIPIDSLFAALRETAPAGSPSSPASTLEAAGLDAVSTSDGRVAATLPAERNTREYGSREPAAGMVDESFRSTCEGSPDPTPATFAHPSSDADWSGAPSDANKSPSATVTVTIPTTSMLEAEAVPTMGPPFPTALAASALPQSGRGDTDAIVIEPPPPTASESEEERASAADSAPVEASEEAPADLRLAASEAAVDYEDTAAKRLWPWAVGAFVVGAIGFLVVARTHPAPDAEPSNSLSARDAANSKALPPQPLAAAAAEPGGVLPSSRPATNLAPEGPPPQPQPQPKSVKPDQRADPAELHRKCIQVDADGKGKAKAVASVCRTALHVAPQDVDVMIILARAELDRGRTGEVRSLAKRALAVDPSRLDAYVYLGNAEQEAGKSEEARSAYKKYLELAPNGPFAKELRAILSSL